MKRKYASPPIVEAVCGFQFTPDSEWDPTVPGLLYQKLCDDFPKKGRGAFEGLKLGPAPGGLEQEVRISERTRFLTEDGKRFVQIGDRVLSVHCLKPYPGWTGLKPTIEKAFSLLRDSTQVKGLQRIGLRYINRIEIPSGSVTLEEYFEYRPLLGPNLPRQTAVFLLGCLLPFSGGRDCCRLQLATSQPEKPDASAFALDLDYFLEQAGAIPADKALEWVESAHERILAVFEACITDRLRNIFGEEK